GRQAAPPGPRPGPPAARGGGRAPPCRRGRRRRLVRRAPVRDWTLIHLAALQVERGHEDEVRRWYRDELAPELTRDPAFVELERLECTTGEPTLWLFHIAEEIDPHRVIPFVDEDRGRRIRNYTARTFGRRFQVG